MFIYRLAEDEIPEELEVVSQDSDDESNTEEKIKDCDVSIYLCTFQYGYVQLYIKSTTILKRLLIYVIFDYIYRMTRVVTMMMMTKMTRMMTMKMMRTMMRMMMVVMEMTRRPEMIVNTPLLL